MRLFISAMTLMVGAAFASSTSAEENPGQKGDQANGPIRLESIFIGDKEQPAISYFIPWQGVGAPDKLHWNVEEKHDGALDTVDREIMLRSIRLYGELELDAKNPR